MEKSPNLPRLTTYRTHHIAQIAAALARLLPDATIEIRRVETESSRRTSHLIVNGHNISEYLKFGHHHLDILRIGMEDQQERPNVRYEQLRGNVLPYYEIAFDLLSNTPLGQLPGEFRDTVRG